MVASDSLDSISRVLYGALEQMTLDAAGLPRHEYHQRVSVIVGNSVITATGYSKAQALAERDRLERLGLQSIDPEGNGYVIEGKTFMVKVRATASHEAAYHIMNIAGTPSIPEVLIVRLFTKAIAALASRVAGTARSEVGVAG